jgi:hypothetical protein
VEPERLPANERRGTLMRMRKPLAIVVGFAFVAGSGALAYMALRPEPEPPPALDAEKSYDQIERPEYEKWMQDLGYTE